MITRSFLDTVLKEPRNRLRRECLPCTITDINITIYLHMISKIIGNWTVSYHTHILLRMRGMYARIGTYRSLAQLEHIHRPEFLQSSLYPQTACVKRPLSPNDSVFALEALHKS
jgi:hypothetical protein